MDPAGLSLALHSLHYTPCTTLPCTTLPCTTLPCTTPPLHHRSNVRDTTRPLARRGLPRITTCQRPIAAYAAMAGLPLPAFPCIMKPVQTTCLSRLCDTTYPAYVTRLFLLRQRTGAYFVKAACAEMDSPAAVGRPRRPVCSEGSQSSRERAPGAGSGAPRGAASGKAGVLNLLEQRGPERESSSVRRSENRRLRCTGFQDDGNRASCIAHSKWIIADGRLYRRTCSGSSLCVFFLPPAGRGKARHYPLRVRCDPRART